MTIDKLTLQDNPLIDIILFCIERMLIANLHFPNVPSSNLHTLFTSLLLLVLLVFFLLLLLLFSPQDLLRFTHTTHPDKIHLQMALARFEGIADYLNEAKRQVEQRSIVEHLNNKVTGLPFKLVDSKRWLHRQDVVTRLVSCLYCLTGLPSKWD